MLRRMALTEAEIETLARDVDDISGKLAPFVTDRDPVAASMALMKLAAEIVYHSEGDREELLATARAAWRAVQDSHAQGSCAQH